MTFNKTTPYNPLLTGLPLLAYSRVLAQTELALSGPPESEN